MTQDPEGEMDLTVVEQPQILTFIVVNEVFYFVTENPNRGFSFDDGTSVFSSEPETGMITLNDNRTYMVLFEAGEILVF